MESFIITLPPTALIFIKNTATTPVQILYKGGSLAMPDLISGRLTFMIPVASEGIPHVSSGKLRALAVTGNQRMKALPEVPTMREAGIENLDGIIWWGLFAPVKTPPAIVERVSKEMLTLLEYPEVATAFAQLGIEPAPLNAQQFANFYQTEIQTYAQVAKEFNLIAK
jgi:tripartite-type tricarboxylate transporter receptor subunit TctC